MVELCLEQKWTLAEYKSNPDMFNRKLWTAICLSREKQNKEAKKAK